MTMSDLIGWLWAILVVLGVGGLGFTIDAYDSAKTRSRRRKNRRQAPTHASLWRRPEALYRRQENHAAKRTGYHAVGHSSTSTTVTGFSGRGHALPHGSLRREAGARPSPEYLGGDRRD